MTEEEIYEGLKLDGLVHDKAVSQLYTHTFYAKDIKSYLRSKGLSKSEVESLWIDVVVRFSFLVKEGKYENQSNMIGFLKNLARYILLNHFKKVKRNLSTDLDEIDPSKYSVEDYGVYNKELKQLLSKELDRLGEVCKNILLLWSRSYSMKEIMKKVNVVSEAAVRKRKHKCFKKLLSNIESDTSLAELLKSYLQK